MKSDYDIIIIGAGPAGAMAGRVAASCGLSVLILERKKIIGYPSHCAGGILTLILDQMNLISVVSESIKTRIRKFRVISPFMRIASHQFKRHIGYIVDRPRFDQLLCEDAKRKGAEIFTQTRAVGLESQNEALNTVVIKRNNEVKRIKSKIIVGADGIASNVAKWAGLSIPRKYVGIGFGYNVKNMRGIDPETVEIYFLSAIPGGYAWIFPKGAEMANVGLGGYNSGTYMRRLFEWFRKKHPIASLKLSNAHLTNYTGGIVPGSKIPRKTTFNHGMIVGDAANQVDPTTGEGIRLALICGELAGRVAVSAIKRNQLSEIHKYHKLWQKSVFIELFVSYLLRHIFLRLNAEDFDIFVKAITRSNLNILLRKRKWYLLFLHGILKTPTLLKLFRKIALPLPPYVKPSLKKT
ncbi:MAG: NAD(P)/FAD-dependent oxidoreductase [Candidatus Helarchaeota archaeon]|nr:NAD(P)/FAD-dependent oxidoreductase [Candidatus Helarchaeota archaeon]